MKSKSKTNMNNESGFSLIELLIAMAIFAIGSLAVAALFYSSSTGIRNTTELTDAIFIADEYLARTLALKYRNTTNVSSPSDCMKSTTATKGKYSIAINVAPTDPTEPIDADPTKRAAGSTARITVSVTWPALFGNGSYSLQYIRPETRSSGI